jgi:hypothetical protein
MRKNASAPSPVKSGDRLSIEEALAKLSPTARVDDFQNPNGHVIVAEATRTDSRVVRIYVEGASALAAAERVLLAAVTSLLGGVK